MAAREQRQATAIGWRRDAIRWPAATLGLVDFARQIHGSDIHAVLRHLGPGAYESDLAEAWIDEDAVFTSIEEVSAACPPERIGLSPGAFAALLAPLFGEFE